MSNLERQRRFRAAHPGYFRKYKTRRRPDWKAAYAAALAAASANVATPEPPALPEPVAMPVKPAPLMLPGPADIPVIPGINAIAAMPAPAPQAVSHSATTPAVRSLAA